MHACAWVHVAAGNAPLLTVCQQLASPTVASRVPFGIRARRAAGWMMEDELMMQPLTFQLPCRRENSGPPTACSSGAVHCNHHVVCCNPPNLIQACPFNSTLTAASAGLDMHQPADQIQSEQSPAN